MKPVASLSLDLDNLWSYMKTHGDSGWQSFPSYFETIVPRMLDFFSQRRLKLTVFVVGQDLLDPRNRDAIRAIAAAGHELGNHSFSHEPWLHLELESKIEDEIARTEELLESVIHKHPVGFRGPGYCYSDRTLRVLKRRGYLYDASLLPTWIGPLARSYYFLTGHFDTAQLAQRRTLFGSLRDGFRRLKPHHLGPSVGNLLEIPVTTMPFVRIPIHVSYVLYLGTFSPKLAISYFRWAISLCRIAGVEPSLLLHPPDFMNVMDAPDLFFPAMRLPASTKAELVEQIVDIYSESFSVLTLEDYAKRVCEVTSQAAEPQRSSVF